MQAYWIKYGLSAFYAFNQLMRNIGAFNSHDAF
jgi:hypothetical protein